jgi:hypothetical protein
MKGTEGMQAGEVVVGGKEKEPLVCWHNFMYLALGTDVSTRTRRIQRLKST